jgi:hypothetical protein
MRPPAADDKAGSDPSAARNDQGWFLSRCGSRKATARTLTASPSALRPHGNGAPLASKPAGALPPIVPQPAREAARYHR